MCGLEGGAAPALSGERGLTALPTAGFRLEATGLCLFLERPVAVTNHTWAETPKAPGATREKCREGLGVRWGRRRLREVVVAGREGELVNLENGIGPP